MAAHPKLIRQKPLDVWTTRERLLLASSVLQSGDQNWVSVSRAIKNHSTESRPAEYFSQKNCALQYGELLENAETPKRKRSDKNEVIPVETQGLQIVNKLKYEYMEHLVKEVRRQQDEYLKLSDEIEMVKSGHCDEQLSEIWAQIQRKQNEKQEVDEPGTTLSQSETSIENDQTISSLTTTAPDADDTSTQDSQDADIEVDDNTQDLPSFTEEVMSTPAKAEKTASIPQDSTDKQQTSFSVSGSLPSSAANTDQEQPEIVVELTEGETTLESVAATTTNEQSADSQADESVSADVTTDTTAVVETTAVADTTTEPDVEKEPEEQVNVTKEEPVEPPVEHRSRKKARTPSKSRQLSETSLQEEITVDDEVPPKPAKTTSPARPSSHGADKPTSQLTINVVPAEIEGALSPEITASLSSDVKVKEQPPQSVGSAASRRRSSRVTKQKDEKKEEAPSANQGVTKASSEPETLSDDEDSTANVSKTVDLAPDSPTTSHFSETEDEKGHKSWKRNMLAVWRTISHHKYSNVFMHQVTDDIAPGYSTCVHRPMSLSVIKQNLEKNVIKTTEEFTRDTMLMFVNAIMYNNHEYDVYAMAQEMSEDAMRTIEQQAHVKEVEVKPTALRGRRSDTSSSGDKETEKGRRRASVDQHSEVAPPAKKRKTRADD